MPDTRGGRGRAANGDPGIVRQVKQADGLAAVVPAVLALADITEPTLPARLSWLAVIIVVLALTVGAVIGRFLPTGNRGTGELMRHRAGDGDVPDDPFGDLREPEAVASGTDVQVADDASEARPAGGGTAGPERPEPAPRSDSEPPEDDAPTAALEPIRPATLQALVDARHERPAPADGETGELAARGDAGALLALQRKLWAARVEMAELRASASRSAEEHAVELGRLETAAVSALDAVLTTTKEQDGAYAPLP